MRVSDLISGKSATGTSESRKSSAPIEMKENPKEKSPAVMAAGDWGELRKRPLLSDGHPLCSSLVREHQPDLPVIAASCQDH